MRYRITLPVMALLLLIAPSFAAGQKLKPEEIVSRHLQSIGTAESRSGVKSLIAVGEIRVDFITQKNHPATGRLVMASEGNKVFIGMSLNAADYAQEKIIHTGSKTEVALVRAGNRSVLGNFIQTNSSIVSQGIFGGAFSTGWALLEPELNGGKLSSSGTKKVNGKEAHALRFTPKGGGDVEITMFFDTETFRHVRTEYSRTSSASIGRNIDDSARQQESRIKLTEDFSDFKEIQGGLTLPTKYKIFYSISGARGTTEVSWLSEIAEFALNQALDPATFQAGE